MVMTGSTAVCANGTEWRAGKKRRERRIPADEYPGKISGAGQKKSTHADTEYGVENGQEFILFCYGGSNAVLRISGINRQPGHG